MIKAQAFSSRNHLDGIIEDLIELTTFNLLIK